MHDWLAQIKPPLTHGEALVLVTVAQTDGSAPRDAGARMLISRGRVAGTVGGGHLEWKAIETARRLLSAPQTGSSPLRQLERLPLGPSLGQCCGGAVILAYERLTLADLGWVAALQKRDEAGLASMREVCFPTPVVNGDASAARRNESVLPPVHWHAIEGDSDGPVRASCQLRPSTGDGTRLTLQEVLLPDRFHVVLFGAGHVGSALVKILLHLRCTIHWVDTREIPFPPLSGPNLTTEHHDAPQAVIDRAPPGSYFLVMTHSHTLDQELSAHILRRADFAYFGLIGSLSKRRQFEHRLLARGIDAGQVARMVCPIGIPGIRDKAPDAIAIAVAAQLLQQVETRRGDHLAMHPEVQDDVEDKI